MPEPVVHDSEHLAATAIANGQRYLEFLRVPNLSAGIYVLPAGGTDPQQPHLEDELYVVITGRAVIQVGDDSHPVGPGAVIYVPATVPHRFVDITEDLRVAVMFAPPETFPTP